MTTSSAKMREKETMRLAKKGIWRWEDFKLQLDDFELGFFQSSVNTARKFGKMEEVRIGSLRYAVGANIVMLIQP